MKSMVFALTKSLDLELFNTQVFIWFPGNTQWFSPDSVVQGTELGSPACKTCTISLAPRDIQMKVLALRVLHSPLN